MSQNTVSTGPDDVLIRRIESLERTIQQMQAAQAIATQNMTGLTLTEGTITGATIIGGVLETAASGKRVRIGDDTQEIQFFDSAGNLAGVLYANPVTLLLADVDTGTAKYALSGTTSYGGGANSAMQISAGTAVFKVISSGFAEIDGADLAVNGNFSVSGSKAFDIVHPDGTERKRLRYISIEGPEVLVMCRGNTTDTTLPEHFTLVTEPDSVQYVIGDDGNGGTSWVATGIRKGYADFDPEYMTNPNQESDAQAV